MQRKGVKTERTRFGPTTGFVLAAAAAWLGACSHPPDDVRIRQTIEAMRVAAEARDASGVLDGIAADFSGQDGRLDRASLGRMLKLEFLRNDAPGVRIGAISIELEGDRAKVAFDMNLVDASRRWLPGGRETYAVVGGWRREGSRWLCYNATWTTND